MNSVRGLKMFSYFSFFIGGSMGSACVITAASLHFFLHTIWILDTILMCTGHRLLVKQVIQTNSLFIKVLGRCRQWVPF